MENEAPKGIADAERNRRTLEKPANQLPWFFEEQVPNTTSNYTQKAPKWEPKSRSPKASPQTVERDHFGTHFGIIFA